MPQIKENHYAAHAFKPLSRYGWDAANARRNYNLESQSATNYFCSVKPIDGIRHTIILFRDAAEVSAPALFRFKHWVKEAIYDKDYGDYYIQKIDEDFGEATTGLAVSVKHKNRLKTLANYFAKAVERRNVVLDLTASVRTQANIAAENDDTNSVDSIGPEIEHSKQLKKDPSIPVPVIQSNPTQEPSCQP